MKRTFDKTQLGVRCMVCGKGPVSAVNKPHSQKRTKRLLKPNVQSVFGLLVCTRCLRSMKASVKTQDNKATTPVETAQVAA